MSGILHLTNAFKTHENVNPGGILPNMGIIKKNNVTMFVLTPRAMADQKVRPLLYSFTNQFRDDLNNKLLMDDQSPIVKKNQSHLMSIKPTPQGSIPVRMDDFQTLPSFIMIIDTVSTNHQMANFRYMYTGFFLTPDIVSPYGAINENAALSISNRVLLANMGRGFDNRPDIKDASTVMSENISLFKPQNTSLFNLPGDLVSSGPSPTAQEIYNLNADFMGKNSAINKAYSCPTQLINQMAHQFLTGYRAEKYEKNMPITNIPLAWESKIMDNTPYQNNEVIGLNIRQNLINNAPSIRFSADRFAGSDIGLDINQTHTLGSIRYKYGEIDMKITKRDTGFSNPILDHRYDTEQNVLSYLLSEIIPGVAHGCGIAEISFDYDSNIGMGNTWSTIKNPRWIPMRIYPLHDMSPEQLHATGEKFKMYMMTDVFPIIESHLHGSDFMCLCNYQIGFGAQIQLLFKDAMSQCDPNGCYESYDQLSPFTTPIVATQELFFNNSNQMNGLINSLSI